MKIEISLGANQLVLSPETDFEKDWVYKYFRGNGIKGLQNSDGEIHLNFNGPAGDSEKRIA